MIINQKSKTSHRTQITLTAAEAKMRSLSHLVHVEYEVQFTDVFKAFIQRFYKHLQGRCFARSNFSYLRQTGTTSGTEMTLSETDISKTTASEIRLIF